MRQSTKWIWILPTLVGLVLMASLLIRGVAQAHEPEPTAPDAPTEEISPYIVAIPGSGRNGASLTVSASGLSGLAAPVFVIADDGPTSDKHSHSMTLDTKSGLYRHVFEGFFDTAGQVSGSVEITSTTGTSQTVSSGVRSYERWAVDRAELLEVNLAGGDLYLLFNPESFAADLTYVLILDTYAPSSAPAGLRAASRVYSIQPSGATATSEIPYVMAISYNPEILGDVDPETLAIYRFNADSNVMAWQRIGGSVHQGQQKVETTTDLFGTFSLFGDAPDEPTMIHLPMISKAP